MPEIDPETKHFNNATTYNERYASINDDNHQQEDADDLAGL